jgi:hypothetical protein
LVKAQWQPRKEGKEQDKFSSRGRIPVGIELPILKKGKIAA